MMPSQNDPTQQRLRDDRAAVENILAGSDAAWEAFVHEYTPLMHSVIRRALVSFDDDEVRTAVVDALYELKTKRFSEFRGDCFLSTFVVVVCRGLATDRLRHAYGRKRMPAGYDDLAAYDQEVFRLFHIEKLPFEIVIHTLKWLHLDANPEAVASAIHRIEEKIDERYLNKLHYEHHAKGEGVTSGRMLRYCMQVRAEMERVGLGQTPDMLMEESETRAAARRLVALIATLDQGERDVVELRYLEGWSAPKVARHLSLESPWKVHSVARRALKRLRRLMSTEETL